MEGPWEYGNWIGGGGESASGYQSDVERVMKALKEGKSEEEILDEYPVEWARHYKGIERYRMIKAPRRSFKTEFDVHIGD